MTVVETVRFLRDAENLLSVSDRTKLVEFVGANPEAGDLIPETGGVRKLRWALPGGGKRGGARVIYLFHNAALPIFLLAMYGENEKANLTRGNETQWQKSSERLSKNIRGVAKRNEKNEEAVGPIYSKEDSVGWCKNL